MVEVYDPAEEDPNPWAKVCGYTIEFDSLITWVLILGMGYTVLWCLFKKAAEPGGWLFTLLAVYGFGTVGEEPLECPAKVGSHGSR